LNSNFSVKLADNLLVIHVIVFKFLLIRNLIRVQAVWLVNFRFMRIFRKVLGYDNTVTNRKSSRVMKVLVEVERALEGEDLANTSGFLAGLIELKDRRARVGRVRVVLFSNSLWRKNIERRDEL
jgi:hypothetical protein